CIHKDSKVSINGELISIELIWKLYKTAVILDSENGEWSIPLIDLIVTSYDENSEWLVSKKVLRLYREKVITYLKEIVLESGNKIRITNIHKLLTISGWTNDLEIGQSVAEVNNNNIIFSKITQLNHTYYDNYVY